MIRRRRTLLKLGIIAAIVVLAFAMAYVYVLPRIVFVPMRFDSDKWKSNPSEFSHSSIRLRMVDDYLDRQQPVGMTSNQIVAILGDPDDTEYFADYDLVYHLGQERGFVAIDSEWLVMRLDQDGVVTEASLVTD